MKINKLQLNNFRNYDQLSFELSPNVNVIIGDNAQGKTNLLEAIYISAIGKSFRTDKENEIIRFNEQFTKITVEYVNFNNESKINSTEFYLDKRNKKQIKDNGLTCDKLSDHIGKINVVVFSPENLNVVKGAPSKRRKYLDVLLSQISNRYLKYLQSYNKFLKLKNSILKQDSKQIDNTYLDIIDEKIAEFSEYIVSCRTDIILELIPSIKKIHSEITCNKEIIDIEYKSDFKDNKKYDILEKLKRNRYSDIIKKTSSIGIQKDDISITINNLPEVYFSQGQTRTALLSMKFAEFEILSQKNMEEPVLLLDDVFSELDDNRINYILKYISKYQSIITTNEKSRIKLDNIKFFSIQRGKLID